MSSPYTKLGNRSLDQWKVVELKEELKKRKLTTKGLKEELVRRLDEAVRLERESAVENEDNDASQSESPSEQEKTESDDDMVEKVDAKSEHEIDAVRDPLGEDKVVEADSVQEIEVAGLEEEHVAHVASVETTIVTSEAFQPVTALSGSNSHIDGTNEDGDSTVVINNDGLPHSQADAILELSDSSTQLPQINKSSIPVEPPSEPNLQDSETENEAVHSMVQMETDESKSVQPNPNVQPSKYQVSEVDPDLGFQVTSDSVSTESVPIIEKNELKVDVITDNVQLELDLKHEMAQPSPTSAVHEGGVSHPMGVEEPLYQKDLEEPHDKKDFGEPLDKNDVEKPLAKNDVGEPLPKEPMEAIDGSIAENVVILENLDTGDLAPAEKLSLDRSSGDDSMEEDVLETKQMEYKSDSNKISDNVETSEMLIVKEDDDVDVVGHDKPVETKVSNAENETVPALTSVKRKFHDKEAVGNNDNVKKPRRWNAEGKGSEPQSGNIVSSVTPKGLSGSTTKPSSGTIPAVNEAPMKERLVPPSSKLPSNSLRIDRFLRPFTLKAVQELLGKTGTVTGFWMDHIKTHCYVSYSSVEEAVETRNAVYNLQWPPNGGRLLMADFVDPQEVRTHVEAPPASPATPSTSAAPTFSATQPQATMQPQPSPRQQVMRQQLPPPSLPPPPLSNPPAVRERLHLAREPLPRDQSLPARDRVNLPPPPPLPEKVDPPLVTLDDLFRKTKTIPRIYYLPLSEDQVAAKLKTQGKNVNQ